MREKETYLGDGLFASFDGWQVRLRAPRENGDHEVFLEPEVMITVKNYINSVLKQFDECASKQWSKLDQGGQS